MWERVKKLVRITYIIFLMGFTVWYGHFMYPLIFGFEEKQEAAASLLELGGVGTEEEKLFVKLIVRPEKTETIDLGYRLIEQPDIEGRFHNIGFSIESDEASVCVKCHGTVVHDKSKEIRSFLNMHAFYIACETCHVYPQKGEAPYQFRWYDKKSGERVSNPVKLVEIEDAYRNYDDDKRKYIAYGDYGAKIAPGKIVDGEFEFLKRGKLMDYVHDYIEHQTQLSSAQKSQGKKVIHRSVNEKPMECNRCHNDDEQYIPFAELGYPPRRVEELTTTEVVGMIDKYKEFWIPNILTPGEQHD